MDKKGSFLCNYRSIHTLLKNHIDLSGVFERKYVKHEEPQSIFYVRKCVFLFMFLEEKNLLGVTSTVIIVKIFPGNSSWKISLWIRTERRRRETLYLLHPNKSSCWSKIWGGFFFWENGWCTSKGPEEPFNHSSGGREARLQRLWNENSKLCICLKEKRKWFMILVKTIFYVWLLIKIVHNFWLFSFGIVENVVQERHFMNFHAEERWVVVNEEKPQWMMISRQLENILSPQVY